MNKLNITIERKNLDINMICMYEEDGFKYYINHVCKYSNPDDIKKIILENIAEVFNTINKMT